MTGCIKRPSAVPRRTGLVGINATRLFSVLYHRTLNIGRVMSPTLALIVQREAEIDTFKPVPFYTVTLELPGFFRFRGAHGRQGRRPAAEKRPARVRLPR